MTIRIKTNKMVSKKLQNQVVPLQNNFKESTRKKLTESRSTIENEHEKKLRQFREKDCLEFKIQLLRSENLYLYPEEIEQFEEILQPMEKAFYKQHDDMVHYLLNLGQFLMENNEIETSTYEEPTGDKSYPTRFPKPPNQKPLQPVKSEAGNKVTDIVSFTNTNNRGARYRKFVDNVINNVNCVEDNDDEVYCKECNVPLITDTVESAMICPECGYSVDYIDTSGMTYNMFTDTTIEPVNIYEYKRINHLNDWMASLQGQESVVISNEIILLVNDEIRKMRLDKSKLKPTHIKMILKKLKLNKYYEHTHAIICRITNKKSIHLSSELQEQIREMFLQAERTFCQMENKSRTNFLSYSYLLNKLVTLCGAPELAENFPLLKSRQKLSAQEEIWRSICRMNGWEFHPSM